MRLFSLAGLIAVALALSACAQTKTESTTRPAVPVSVADVLQKDVPVEIHVIGTVEAYSTVAVGTQATGELKAIHFKEGQDVRQGDLLFTIDPRSFESDLRRAEANLARNIALGKQAQANLARDTAQAKLAEVETGRYKRLVEQGIVSREEYDRTRANAEALEAVMQADRAAIENSEQAMRADRAAIETAKLHLQYCSIRSPIDGRTGNLIVHPGNLVKANDTTLVIINQVSPLYVSFALPEQTLPDVKRYMAAGKLRVEARAPNDEKRPAHGVLSFVNNAVDSATGTIRLKATFANQDKRLWPGQFVNVVLNLTTAHGAIVVPSQAVQTGQVGAYVFVVKPDLSVESRPVSPGGTVAGETVIEQGLRPGEKVVTDGQLRLVPGARVEIKDALESRQGARP